MNRSLPFIVLGVAAVLLFWCCAAGVVLGIGWLVIEPQVTRVIDQPVTEVPEPARDLERRPPTAEERQTAELIANALVPDRDLIDLGRRFRGLPESWMPEPRVEAPAYKLGDTEVFWLHDVGSNSFFTATAELRAATPHAYWWIEQGYAISANDLARSAKNFEEQTYPTNRRIFGSEWTPGIDADPHIYIFLGNVPGVGGYFSVPDEYPVELNERSNMHEMFYINLENAMPGNDYFDGILAHEFQHMIHWAQDRDEDTWVNEGLSELAAQVNGYDVGRSDLAFSASPDTQLTAWAELGDSAPHYGASYLFMAYLLSRYGEETISLLVQEPANSIKGVEAVLAKADPGAVQFIDVYGDWVVANYLRNRRAAGGRYGYADIVVYEPRLAGEHDDYPAEVQASVHQYAADYVVLESEGDLTVEFTGTTLVPLVGNESHSGEFQWWSNRDDESDVTLTRAFDLTGLQKATLEAWMWYDLELDYDYAYVQVSDDGGDTWTILANDHTTTTNPSGNSYGPALTGKSGGGVDADWVRQTFDLTPFAGDQVLVRFEVITDEELNRPGLCLDDISIPELDYQHDAEGGNDGWQAKGFLRVTGQIPQEFLVQVIYEGDEPRVVQMALDERSHGSLTIAGLGREVKRVVLVISAIAPLTTEQAPYRYRITNP